MVKEDAVIRVLGDSIGYVSRGGLKLAKAIKEFKLDLTDLVVADIGASTGGFTDCSLKNGAKKVFAIDVGYGQLAWSLRTDERVVNMERTNIRYVTPEDIGEPINFASIDVAFISLDKVLPVAKTLLSDDGKIVALIKPQFEAGKDEVGKKGIVKDPKTHLQDIENVITYAKKNNIKVVAEGIETREELQMAICLGADYLQGYYLGIPSKTPTKLALSVTEMIQDVNCGKTTK